MKTFQLPPQGGPIETYKDEEVKGREEDPLEQNFKILEQEWNFFKQMNPRKSQYSADSYLSDDYLQSVIENTPREVMSPLQQCRRLSSEGYLCNWKHNDRAAVEIIKDRWHAIESGKLKGRRLLFDDLSSGETGEDICCESVQESEGGLVSTCGSEVGENENEVENFKKNMATDFCLCYSSSFKCEERVVVGREEVKGTEKVEVKSGMISYRKIWLGVVTWLGVIFGLFIVSRRKFNGGYVEECEERVVVGREEVKVTEKVEVKSGLIRYRKIWLGVVAWHVVIFGLFQFDGGYVEEVMLVPT